jgi:hypothetical protein
MRPGGRSEGIHLESPTMRFYYYSFFGVLLILLVYALGGALLGALWFALRRWERAWILMLPLFALLLILPWAEELLIAWNFGQLCKKDAGIFVYHKVQVDGFYDSTMRSGYENIDRVGYRFMEQPSRDKAKIEHIEKSNDVWKVTILDRPTARYQYVWTDQDTPMSHKVDRIERAVLDAELNQQLARDTKYRRRAPWFYVGLDRPVMLCSAPGADPLQRTGSVSTLALEPTKN